MNQTPVVFIHGLWLHATSWNPWVDLFPGGRVRPVAPGWPGDPDTVEEARAHPEPVADHRHRRRRPVTTPTSSTSSTSQPILIGHSFGGLIAEKLLGPGLGAAGVAIDPAQIKGVLPLPLSQLRAGAARAREPGQPAQGRLADRRTSSASASGTP